MSQPPQTPMPPPVPQQGPAPTPAPMPLAYSPPGPYQHPPPFAGEAQASKDAEHLRLLSLFHYIYGALTMALGLVFVFHIVFGLMMVSRAESFVAPPPGAGGGPGGFPATGPAGPASPPPPDAFAFFGYFFAGVGAAVMLFNFTLGLLTIYSGRCLKWRRRRTFSLVVAGINCISVPLGTALGVFTFMVLMRDSIRALYTAEAPRPPSSPPSRPA